MRAYINVVERLNGLAQSAKHIWTCTVQICTDLYNIVQPSYPSSTVVSRSSCDCKSRLPWAKLCRCLQPMCWERCSLAAMMAMSVDAPMISADHIWSQYTSSIMFNMYCIYIYIYELYIYIYINMHLWCIVIYDYMMQRRPMFGDIFQRNNWTCWAGDIRGK